LRTSKRFLGVVLAAIAILVVLNVPAQTKTLGATENILWSFGTGTDASGGAAPLGGLIMDSKGSLYGTTPVGGTHINPANGEGYGTVFELTPPSSIGGPWTESILWNFGNSDGSSPERSLIMDSGGNLYGTTFIGGAFSSGTVFELKPTDGAGWNESVLWDFGNGTDGAGPVAGLSMDKSGNLYGTTAVGGTDKMGTVFELTPSGAGWNESVLWDFGNGTDGAGAFAGLIMDGSGNLYGTTREGGVSGAGTVFELTAPTGGGSWTESILWNFNPGSRGKKDGFAPEGDLVMDAGGNLYGTTSSGGTYFQDPSDHPSFVAPGIVFKLAPPSTAGGSWTESILRNFGKPKDGYNPHAGLILDKSGNLYGTTDKGGAYGPDATGGSVFSGTVFALAPPLTAKGKWTESIVWSFGNGSDGYFPGNLSEGVRLLMDTQGNLYGTTQHGGADPDSLFGYKGFGTVFKITTALTAAPTALNFGNVVAPGTSKPKTVTLTNKEKLAAEISSVTVTAAFKIASGANTCASATVAPGKSCSFEVEFAPTTVADVANGSIDVMYNGISPVVTLEGNGTAAP